MSDREVLFGKLAIGRRALTRADAVRAFNGRAPGQALWDALVALGLVPAPEVQALLAVLDQGALVCRGECGARFQLAELTPTATERCGACGGPLFVAREAPATPTPEQVFGRQGDTWRMERPPASEVPAPAVVAPARPANNRAANTPPSSPHVSSQVVAAHAVPHAAATPAATPAPAPSLAGGKKVWADTADAPPPGFTTFTVGDHDVIGPIGKGGMGSVYRARHRSLNRVVALKLLDAEDKDQRARFQREITAIAKLNHPNIVKIHKTGDVPDEGPHKGKPYFSMEFVDGRDLATWARESPRTPFDSAKMVAKVCDAMDYAHSKMIIHRDLKPQNILIARANDDPKVCDFGLAQVRAEGHQLTRTGDVMGTPQYMPPEQALGDRRRIGPPTDVYALGAILYELLCGRPPFVASKLHVLIAMVVRDTPAPPSRIAKDRQIPPALEQIVMKALEKDPVKRFHTPGDLGRALRAVVGGGAPAKP